MTKALYQGPVQPGYDEKKFRETGKYEKLKESKKEDSKFKKIKDALNKRPKKWNGLFKKEKRPSVNVRVANTNLLSPMERERSAYFQEEWEDSKRQVFFSP